MDPLAQRFEEHRPHLRAVAYRLLGSLAEADEAVQDAWVRASRSGAEGIDNVAGWLTTIVARVCLNLLQARRVRERDTQLPDPIVSVDPEHEVMLADAVGLALQIVLDTLPPAQRVAFVMHDMFEVSFEDIGAMVGRTPVAARQLAARARKRVREASVPDPDLEEQRRVVAAFFAATTSGDFEALLGLLHPDVVLRSDGGEQRKMSFVRRGVEEVARGALAGVLAHAELRPVLVNGAAGMLVLTNGQPLVVMAFTVAQGKIVEIDAVLGRERLAQLVR